MQPVMLITGGSRGIGEATVRLAAANGYAVVVNYGSSAERANSLAAELRRDGATATAIGADVADEVSVLAMFEQIDREFGQLDVLVNNAATAAGYGKLIDIDVAATKRMLDVNVLGSIVCCREALKRMIPRESGSIINISSAAAKIGGVGEWVDYAASKGAIDTLTIGLAREVATTGVRVNGVRPGLIDTEFNDHASPGRLDRMAPMIPMQRAGTPHEIAEAVLWLASPAASYVTGSTIDVTGGR
jgi:NAD(P)-dependent dehydrogenase (short-subunit alcohol dehydrogenase family)